MSALSELFALEKAGRYQEALEHVQQHRQSAPGFLPISRFNLDLLEERLQARLFGFSKERRKIFPAGGLARYPAYSAYSAAGPKLSIIMPVFNVGPYLDACLLSVRYQSFRDFELILVDDASTDNSGEILRLHAELDSRIRVISLGYNTPGGAGIPSNIGLRAARGQYIGFVDSDDWITETAFENLVAAAERHQADVVIGGFRTFVEQTHDYSEAYDLAELQKIPSDEIFTSRSRPEVFHLSPVPWRKLYRRAFLEAKEISYPEGDYFYEDNPLHWFVLAAHGRLVKIDEIVAYHRMEREGQTMSYGDHRLAAICSHMNTIGRFLTHHLDLPQDQVLVNEFYDYVYRGDWILQRQERENVKAILGKRLAQIVEKYRAKIAPTNVRQNFHKRMRKYSEAYRACDLTIVIPTFDCEDFIEKTIDSALNIPGIAVDVLVIDDDSRDGTVEICQRLAERHKNLHFFQQKNRGPGRARNALIPLSTGLYTFFLDADDCINGEAMARAIKEARKRNDDLYFMKYQIEFHEKKVFRGMFDTDESLWKKFPQAKSDNERRLIAASLINYPWNRLIKTELLHDANIFFGSTVVHNDIAFHWESLLATNKIGYGEEVVCTHRKFERRAQITNISDHRRLTAFDALEFTHRHIVEHANGHSLLRNCNEFVSEFLKWLKEHLPKKHQPQYETRKAKMLELLAAAKQQKERSPCMTI